MSILQCIVLCLAIMASVKPAPLSDLTPADRTLFAGTRPLQKIGGWGGQKGDAFDDLLQLNPMFKTVVGIRSINISSADQINAIQVTYKVSDGSLHVGSTHGKNSKPPVTISLASGEYVVKISGSTNGDFVDQLTIVTKGPPDYKHTVYGPFGRAGNHSFTFEGCVLGFYGRSGDVLDNIGIYTIQPAKKSPEFGKHIDTPFDDGINSVVPPIVGISKLHIWQYGVIPAVQFEYLLLDGTTLLGEMHGEQLAVMTTITFDKGEQLVSMSGKTGDYFFDQVDQLSFTTVKYGGVNAHYGPFGNLGRDNFTVSGNIYGFFGSSGEYLYGLGVYYYDL